jgi:lantibiotic transport system permease protein
MNNSFVNNFSAEWIKKRKSFADWLVLIGGFFVPFISILIFIIYPKQLLSVHASGHFWQVLFQKSWQMMAFMLLPMGIVLAVSLITQLEFKNNAWKQLHTTPQPFISIYFSKLALLIVMLLELFILFNIGIYLSAMVPALLVSKIPFPNYTANAGDLLMENGVYFILSLPMVALQYTLSLQFKNFLIPLGVGLALVVGGLIALSWQYSYTLPSAYTALHFLQTNSKANLEHNLLSWSLGYFILFTLLGYWLYISKTEKG